MVLGSFQPNVHQRHDVVLAKCCEEHIRLPTSGTFSICTLIFLSKTPTLAYKASKPMLNNDPGLIVELSLLISKTSSVKKLQGCKGHSEHKQALKWTNNGHPLFKRVPTPYTCSKHVHTIRIFITFLYTPYYLDHLQAQVQCIAIHAHCTCMHMHYHSTAWYMYLH